MITAADRDIVDYHLKFAAEGTDLLVLARALDRLTAQPAACTGCGLTLTLEQIRAGGYLSCCPERNMQPVIKPAAGLVEALTAVRATCKLAVSEGADWKARAIAAEANARTPGTVEVCRMLDCKWKHEYQWGDCEAANCPIRAKATQEPKI